MLKFFELGHRQVIPEMALKQFVGDESLGHVALCSDEGDVWVDFADALELVGVSVVVETSVDSD